jgi:hypothetical protein
MYKLAAPPPTGVASREKRELLRLVNGQEAVFSSWVIAVLLKGPMLNKNCHKTLRNKPRRCSPATLQRHRPVDRVKQPPETASGVGGERCARERHLIAKRFRRHKDAGNKSNLVLQTRDAAGGSIVCVSSTQPQAETGACVSKQEVRDDGE